MITFHGKELSLEGELIKVGEKAPDCTLTNARLEDVRLSSFQGKTVLLMTVPSLDTPVCSKETHRFNQELGRFGSHVEAIVVSLDLPFAQKRWCAGEDVDRIIALSDYKNREFGKAFGVFIPDLGLLARAIFVLDPDFTIQSVHLVQEVTEEPNYDAVLEELSAYAR